MQKINLWITSNYDYPVIVNTESLVVDIDTDKSIARFTVWDDLSCMLEIMDIDTEKYILNERRELSSDEEVIKAFKEFHSLLQNGKLFPEITILEYLQKTQVMVKLKLVLVMAIMIEYLMLLSKNRITRNYNEW